jgi:hypothetical protein
MRKTHRRASLVLKEPQQQQHQQRQERQEHQVQVLLLAALPGARL